MTVFAFFINHRIFFTNNKELTIQFITFARNINEQNEWKH